MKGILGTLVFIGLMVAMYFLFGKAMNLFCVQFKKLHSRLRWFAVYSLLLCSLSVLVVGILDKKDVVISLGFIFLVTVPAIFVYAKELDKEVIPSP